MIVGWPQGIVLALTAFNLVATAILDGRPRMGHHRFGVTLIGQAASLAILWWGGFFA